MAASSGNTEIVKFLLSAKVNPNPRDRWGATPLNDAKRPEIIELLTSAGAEKGVDQNEYAELPNANPNDDQYRLFYAGYKGDTNLMKSLHIQNWKINSYDYDGRTALSLAASEGHLEALKYLVIHGADIYHKDARGNDAIADAKRENRTEVVQYLQTIIE